MIKTVIFDVDNTLYSYDKAHAAAFEVLLTYVKERLGLPPEVFKYLIGKAESELREYMGNVAAVHNRIIRYQRVLEDRGLPLHPYALEMNELYWNTLIHEAAPAAGALETMRILKKQGKRIGIGTDMTARIQFRKLEALGLMPFVDFLVSSEEAGAEKPSSVFFSCCMMKVHCKKQECLFVGDSYKKDVLGAMSAGLKAVWYCPEKGQKETEALQITELSQLTRIVSEL